MDRVHLLRRTLNHRARPRKNQSNFGQRFRLSAMEFTPQQEMKCKQRASALVHSGRGVTGTCGNVELAVVAIN
jgi:hypothetical protein